MEKHWIYGVVGWIIVFLFSVWISIDSSAADIQPRSSFGSGRYDSPWVYGTSIWIYGQGDVEYDTSDDSPAIFWDNENLISKGEMSVKWPLDKIGTQYLRFPSTTKSLIWSLDSSIDLGVTVEDLTVNTGGIDADCNLSVDRVYLVILGKKYDLPFDSIQNAIDKDIYLGAFIPFDLPQNKTLSLWDVSLHVEYTMSMSVSSSQWCDYKFTPWFRWRVGSPTGATFDFQEYGESINISGEDLEEQTDAITSEQKETNSWLGKIYSKILQLFNGGTESDKFEEESKEQSDKLDSLNDQNKVNKPDVDKSEQLVDSNVDEDSIESFGSTLSTFTKNKHVLPLILSALSVALVAYVLFGKR